MFYSILIVVSLFFFNFVITGEPVNCRDRSNFFRHDGGLYFEIPPWQLQPVELSDHIQKMKSRWGSHNDTQMRRQTLNTAMNGRVTRYMDTVIAPFLDTYHRNIQNSYQQRISKVLRRIKDEINAAAKRKQEIDKELTELADELKIPSMCDAERRQIRVVASAHVAQVFACTEKSRESVAKMGKYAEEMIALTKTHMQQITAKEVGDSESLEVALKKAELEPLFQSLSQAAVTLGYELDLSLTNARRHNEQSCEKLTSCISKARKRSDESVANLKDLMKQCVYT